MVVLLAVVTHRPQRLPSLAPAAAAGARTHQMRLRLSAAIRPLQLNPLSSGVPWVGPTGAQRRC